MAGPNLPAPRRILAVFNPGAGGARRSRFEHTLAELCGLGCAVTVRETEAPGHAETIARDTSGDDFDVIAAAGGDGTINEIVNGLGGSPLAVGIIPLGTANVVAGEIGLRRPPAAVASALAYGPVKSIYVGVVNGRRFVLMVGIGFDASVVENISPGLKKKFGTLAYILYAARRAFAAPFAEQDVVVDGILYRAVSIVACNGRRYGGPFVAAPNASLTDDSFQIVLMNGRGWLSIARYGLGLMLGRISMWPDVKIIQGRDVVVEGGESGPVQADGDIVTALPAHIFIDPEPVNLVYPVP